MKATFLILALICVFPLALILLPALLGAFSEEG